MSVVTRTLWLTIFTYGQTFGVFVRILSDDRPLYLSLYRWSTYTASLAWLHCSTGEPQWLQYFKTVLLEIQNVPLRTVFANPVTYNYLTHSYGSVSLNSPYFDES